MSDCTRPGCDRPSPHLHGDEIGWRVTHELALQMTKEREQGWRDAIALMGADPDLYTRMARVCTAAQTLLAGIPPDYLTQDMMVLGSALRALYEPVQP